MFGIADHITGKIKAILGTVDDSLNVSDYWIAHAIKNIKADYGDTVSIDRKNKDLLKFGRNLLVGTSSATIMTQPAAVLNETYVSDNLITTIISTAAGDGEDVVIEGQTISGGVFTFVTQTATLTGQTAVTLTTALARVTRVYNDDATALSGVISVTEDDTFTAGVPDTDTLVHLQIVAGKQNSDKASTTISNTDYWIVTGFYADMLKKTSGFANVDLEIRLVGKAFRHRISISCSSGNQGRHRFLPYLIVPKNSDIRLLAEADASSTDISGGIEGVLAKVVT